MRGSGSIALAANATNNRAHQGRRLERWREVRNSLWHLVDPLVEAGARVAIAGAGSADDVPLRRIVARAGHVTLFDFDAGSTARATSQLDRGQRALVDVVVDDVTAGSADLILTAARDGAPLPHELPLSRGRLGTGGFDLVIGDMLYTQLLHAGMLALGLDRARQAELMHRYDPHLVTALVHRLQASAAPGGRVVHVHDVACWASDHAQPVTLDEALEDPLRSFPKLRRHDACDPHLALRRIGASIVGSAWWRWPFEPDKEFLVRATVARGDVAAGSPAAALMR